MTNQTVSFRMAHWLLSVGMWGVPESEFEDFYPERIADLELQANDSEYGTPLQMMRRAVAGLAWDVRARLGSGNPTLVSRGVLMSLLTASAIVTVFASMVGNTLHSLANASAAIALAIFAWAFFSSPNRLRITPIAISAALLAGSDTVSALTVHPAPGDRLAVIAVVVLATAAISYFLLLSVLLIRSRSISILRMAFRTVSISSFAFAVLEIWAALYRAVATPTRIAAGVVALGLLILSAVMWDLWRFHDAYLTAQASESTAP